MKTALGIWKLLRHFLLYNIGTISKSAALSQ